MKIAIIGSRGYPYVYSGYETFVKELSERLIKHGVEVHIYCHKNLFSSYPRQHKGIHLHYIPTIETKSLSQLIHSFLSLLHAAFSSADLLLVVNAANGPLGWIPKITGKKTMINVDGLEWLRPKWKGLGSRYFFFAAKLATKLYDLVITDAEEMHRVYLQEFNIDSQVIAYGAPNMPDHIIPLSKKWDLEADSYYLVVGRLIPDNNADLIIRGFLETKSDKKLVIVGGVPYKDRYADGLKELASDKLIFLGYITDSNELISLYQNCFVYIHGHKFGGTNPTMLKAMACKCAILALDTPFNREMLNNGKLGILFKESIPSIVTEMEKIETDPVKAGLLKAQVNEGLTEKYDWEFITTAYLEAFKKLINNV